MERSTIQDEGTSRSKKTKLLSSLKELARRRSSSFSKEPKEKVAVVHETSVEEPIQKAPDRGPLEEREQLAVRRESISRPTTKSHRKLKIREPTTFSSEAFSVHNYIEKQLDGQSDEAIEELLVQLENLSYSVDSEIQTKMLENLPEFLGLSDIVHGNPAILHYDLVCHIEDLFALIIPFQKASTHWNDRETLYVVHSKNQKRVT